MTSMLRPYAGTRVLVLGAGGFIGRWVARALHAQGATLHLAVRDVAAARQIAARWGFEGDFSACDLSDAARAEALVAQVTPDVVFNLAGYGVDRSERDPGLATRINTDLPRAVAQGLAAQPREAVDTLAQRPRLVHVGSALEYGEITGDLAETSTPDPTTLYGRTKLAGTLAVARVGEETGLPALTARLFTVFGPGEHAGRLFPTLLESANGVGPIALTEGLQKRDFCFVEDVAEGLLRLGAVAAQPGEIVNLACGRLHTVRDFVRYAAETMGIGPERLAFGAVPTRNEEMEHDPVSIARLRLKTGWSPDDDLRASVARAHACALV